MAAGFNVDTENLLNCPVNSQYVTEMFAKGFITRKIRQLESALNPPRACIWHHGLSRLHVFLKERAVGVFRMEKNFHPPSKNLGSAPG
jgi:hypothetical protein